MVFCFTGAEGLVLACGLGLVAAPTVPRTVIHYRTASSPSFAAHTNKTKTRCVASAFCFTGAEGLEPATCGFGDRRSTN